MYVETSRPFCSASARLQITCSLDVIIAIHRALCLPSAATSAPPSRAGACACFTRAACVPPCSRSARRITWLLASIFTVPNAGVPSRVRLSSHATEKTRSLNSS